MSLSSNYYLKLCVDVQNMAEKLALSTDLPFGPLKRFGLFGGSFDPVHVGHLSIAQQIFNTLKLEKVILLPAATPPHKRDGGTIASSEDRLEMRSEEHTSELQSRGLIS